MGHPLTQTLPSAGGACPFSCLVGWTAVKTARKIPLPSRELHTFFAWVHPEVIYSSHPFIVVVVWSLSHVWFFVSPLDCAPPGSSVGFQNIGVGCHFLLHGISRTQGSKLRLLHWQADSLLLSHQGSPLLTLYLLFIGGLFCSKAPDMQDLSPSGTLCNPVRDTAGGGSSHLAQEVAGKERHLDTILTSCIAHHIPHVTGLRSAYFISVFPTRSSALSVYHHFCLHPTHPAPWLAQSPRSVTEVYQRTRWEIEWKLDRFPGSLTVRTESVRKTKIQFHEINIKFAGIIFCYSGLALVERLCK